MIKAKIALVGLLALGCKPEKTDSAALPERVVAVKAKKGGEETLATFCDVQDTGYFNPPEISGLNNERIKGPLWMNLWATWCKPCIEEIPMIAKWEKQLNEKDNRISVQFVSVDEDPESVVRFVSARPGFPKSAHLTDPEKLPEWLKQLGLDTGAGLPVHVFVSPDRRIRCVRAAAVNTDDFDVIRSLLE